MTKPKIEQSIQQEWILYVDGSLNNKEIGVKIILKSLDDIMLKYSLTFNLKVTNNQAKYKALMAVLQLAEEIGA